VNLWVFYAAVKQACRRSARPNRDAASSSPPCRVWPTGSAKYSFPGAAAANSSMEMFCLLMRSRRLVKATLEADCIGAVYHVAMDDHLITTCNRKDKNQFRLLADLAP
jgi:hypothetical protein